MYKSLNRVVHAHFLIDNLKVLDKNADLKILKNLKNSLLILLEVQRHPNVNRTNT